VIELLHPRKGGAALAKKQRQLPGKRRIRAHVIADLAVNHVERQALLCGFTVERIQSDYGVDLLLFTFDSVGEIEDGYIPVQVKATEALSWLRTEDAAVFRISRKDLVGWLRNSIPVILAVYDVAADTAHWLHVQGYFQAQPGFNLFAVAETLTVRLARSRVLNPTAIREIAALRDEAKRQTDPR
jgi:hypothetical protein